MKENETILAINWTDHETHNFYDFDRASEFATDALRAGKDVEIFFATNLMLLNKIVTLEKPDGLIRK